MTIHTRTKNITLFWIHNLHQKLYINQLLLLYMSGLIIIYPHLIQYFGYSKLVYIKPY